MISYHLYLSAPAPVIKETKPEPVAEKKPEPKVEEKKVEEKKPEPPKVEAKKQEVEVKKVEEEKAPAPAPAPKVEAKKGESIHMLALEPHFFSNISIRLLMIIVRIHFYSLVHQPHLNLPQPNLNLNPSLSQNLLSPFYHLKNKPLLM